MHIIKGFECFVDGQKRYCKFNKTQLDYINTLLTPDFKLRDNHYKEFSVFGGYRAGKSFIQQMIVYILCCQYPNIRCLYMRNTYDELKDSVIKQFNETFLDDGNYEYVQSSKDGSHIAKFFNGSEIRFRSADDPDKLLSNEYDLIALCQAEAIPGEIVNQVLVGRWSGTRLPKKLLLVEGNPAGTWVKFAYADRPKHELEADGIYYRNVDTFENLHNIDPDFIEDYKRKNSEINIRRFIYGEFVGSENMVFTEFSEKNIIAPIDHTLIPPNAKKGIGGDYGWRNPATFVWGYKDYDGRIIIYDSWGGTQQTADMIAKAGLKYGKQPCIYDYSCKEKDKYGFSEWDRINKAGLKLTECSKQDEHGVIGYINSLFKQELLLITANNEQLIWEINNWKYPPQRIGKEENLKESPIDANNHYIDGTKYLITWMEGLRSISPEEEAEQKSFAKMVKSKPKRNILNYG